MQGIVQANEFHNLMLPFENQAFLSALKAKIPTAKNGALSADEKEIARENLHAINSQYKHGPVLGGGALYGVKK